MFPYLACSSFLPPSKLLLLLVLNTGFVLNLRCNSLSALPPTLKLRALPWWRWWLPIHFILESETDSFSAPLMAELLHRLAAFQGVRSRSWPPCSCPWPLHIVPSLVLHVPFHGLIQVTKSVQNCPGEAAQLWTEACILICLLMWQRFQSEVDDLRNCK